MSEKLETMTPELKAFIEEWKSKPGNLIMVLHRVQQSSTCRWRRSTAW